MLGTGNGQENFRAPNDLLVIQKYNIQTVCVKKRPEVDERTLAGVAVKIKVTVGKVLPYVITAVPHCHQVALMLYVTKC